MTDAYLLTWDEKYRAAAEQILRSTAPETQWYMSAEGREKNSKKQVAGFWTSAICIDAAARWTAVMEEKLGRPYEPGRQYVAAYGDFASRFLAGGPDVGFYMSWSPAGGGRGDHGAWTYRLADIAMFGHKYSHGSGGSRAVPEGRRRRLHVSGAQSTGRRPGVRG